jgi:hypothetical protein
LRLALHPEGLAPRIANLHEWRTHLLERLRHQVELTADAVLTYPSGDDRTDTSAQAAMVRSAV